jgi:cytoskeletal protein RodZ
VEENERRGTTGWKPPTWLLMTVVLLFVSVLALALRRPSAAVKVDEPGSDSNQIRSAEQATQAVPAPVVAQAPSPSSSHSESQSSPDPVASGSNQTNSKTAPQNCYDNPILSKFYKETS